VRPGIGGGVGDAAAAAAPPCAPPRRARAPNPIPRPPTPASFLPSPRRHVTVVVHASSISAPTPAPTPHSLLAVGASVAVAALGAFAFGYHLGVVNGPLDAIATSLGFAGDAGKQGAVVSSLLVGATVGSLGGSAVADALGRRGALVATAAPLLAGALLCAGASTLPALLAGRLIAGAGIGLASALVPLYASEVAPARARGALGSVNQLVICIGILGALLANVALPASAWRTMFGAAAVPAALLGVGMLFAPESPRWLASVGRATDADAAARALWGPGGPAELAAGAAAAAPANGGAAAPSLADLFRSRGVRVGCALFLLQQFSGINAIVYFSSSVFATAGVSNGAAASAAVGAVNVLGSAVAASLMDRAGRLTLLTASFGGMAAAMLVMAAGLGLPAFAPVAGPIALAGTLAYVAAFALGAGPVPGLLASEIAPARLRGRAVSAAMATHWVCNFVVGQAFLPTVSAVGVSGAYLFFAGVCLATIAFARAHVVETKGRTLEEIEAIMG